MLDSYSMHNLKDLFKNVNATRKQMPINMRVDNLKEEAVNMRLSPADFSDESYFTKIVN